MSIYRDPIRGHRWTTPESRKKVIRLKTLKKFWNNAQFFCVLGTSVILLHQLHPSWWEAMVLVFGFSCWCSFLETNPPTRQLI